jgi:hypothetical protein
MADRIITIGFWINAGLMVMIRINPHEEEHQDLTRL